MNIGIDGNEANVKNRVGVNEYAFQILKNLQKLQGTGDIKHNLIVYLKEKPLSDLPNETQNFKYKILPGNKLWIVTKLTPYLFTNRDRLDVFFSPSHYLPPISPTPMVCSIMDLGYLEFSGQFTKKDFWQLKLWTAMSILVSKRIISISDSTRKDIVRHYPFSKGKTEVVLLGYDHDRFKKGIGSEDVRRVKQKYSIVDDYILYLGTLKPSKNVEGVIEASAPLLKNRLLVIAGKKGWLYESIFEKASKLGISDRVVFTDFVDEGDKLALVKGAKVFVLPSFWEGFGLDALYAMALGTPVVTSNVGSLPEVVEDAGILVEPTIYSIREGIKKVLSLSKVEYNRMSERCIAQANKFSWEKCARETVRILENVQR